MSKKGITARSQNYSQWYLDVIERAQLAENSSVKGCMVIKPYGYAIWENIQKELDKRIKEMGLIMHTFLCLFLFLFFQKKQVMLRVLQKNVQL